jgi:hypothetical protein
MVSVKEVSLTRCASSQKESLHNYLNHELYRRERFVDFKRWNFTEKLWFFSSHLDF